MNLATMCVGCMDNDTGEGICPKCGSPFDLAPKNTLQLKPRTFLRDQYLIGRALGHGGFGITYLAWDVGLEARLAVKEYMPNGVAGRASGETKVSAYSEQTKQEFEWGLDRFLDEARTLKKFSDHPGIVSVDTIFRENGTAYLVMEYLDGWTLEEFLRRRDGKLSFETALRILTPVLDALTAVHAEGILHRDISPDNIYLTRAGKVKLIDFGAARNALSQKSRNLSIILKEGYAPEEQYRASGIQGPWTDVYAVAATLYHCITGQIPQPALDRMAEDRVALPTRLGADVSPNIENAIMRALSIKAQDRFQSAEDFKSALSGTLIVEAPPPVPVQPIVQAAPAMPPPAPISYAPPPPAPISAHLPPSIPPAPVAPKPRWIWAAALAVVAAGAVAYVAMRPVPGPTGTSGASGAIATTTPTPVAPTGPTGASTQPTPLPTPEPTAPPTPEPTPAGPTNRSRPRPTQPPQPTAAPVTPTPSTPVPTPTPTSPGPGPGPETPTPISDFPGPGNDTAPPAPTGPPPVVPQGADYATLITQAKNAWSARQFPLVQQLLMRAIQLDPKNPRAFSGLGELNLYIYNNPSQAFQSDQAAIARGGEAVFHVFHDHSAGSFVTHGQGYLRISAKGVRFDPVGSTGHSFAVSKAQIREAKSNRDINLTFGRNRRPSIDMHAFHIRLDDGQNFNFAPQSRSGEAERQMILSFIGR